MVDRRNLMAAKQAIIRFRNEDERVRHVMELSSVDEPTARDAVGAALELESMKRSDALAFVVGFSEMMRKAGTPIAIMLGMLGLGFLVGAGYLLFGRPEPVWLGGITAGLLGAACFWWAYDAWRHGREASSITLA